MRSRVVLAVVALAALPAAAGAQFPDQVAPGVRVRMVISDSTRQFPLGPRAQVIIGTVVRRGVDTLHVAVPNAAGLLAVPRASVRALAVSRGVPSPARSALAQGARYAALGVLVFAANHGADDAGRPFRSTGQAALVGGAVGLGLGAVLGAVSPSERWRRVRLGR